jgi:hypothetical protein
MTDVSAAVGVDLNIVPIYGTTLLETQQGLAFSLVAIPRQAVTGVDEVARALEVDLVELPFEFEPREPFITYAIAAILPGDDVTQAVDRLGRYVSVPPAEVDVDRSLLAFASYCASAPIVLVEQSLLGKETLVALITAGGGIAIAAIPAVGVPLAIAYGAGTIVGFGSAAAIGQRIYSWVAPR